jgi:GTP-binding protein
MPLPIVAIIGRPNVGKSTLVNRLAGAKDAIVFDQPGITRDRTYQPAFWRDRDFLVVDTGGLVFDDDTEFLPYIREQALIALAEASAAVFVVDGQQGPTAGDLEIAQWLRRHPVPTVLAVNKCESLHEGLTQAAEFWELGLGSLTPSQASTAMALESCWMSWWRTWHQWISAMSPRRSRWRSSVARMWASPAC